MKTVKYKHHNLATNSEAYRLLQEYRKSGDSKDQKKLDAHLRELDRKYKELHGDWT